MYLTVINKWKDITILQIYTSIDKLSSELAAKSGKKITDYASKIQLINDFCRVVLTDVFAEEDYYYDFWVSDDLPNLNLISSFSNSLWDDIAKKIGDIDYQPEEKQQTTDSNFDDLLNSF